MQRKLSVLVLILAGPTAYAGTNGQVVSYFLPNVPQNTKIEVAPPFPQGFVLTDISGITGTSVLSIYQRQNSVDTEKGRFYLSTGTGPQTNVNMTSGIPIDPNSSLVILQGSQVDITLSGYIPTIAGNAPAVSEWGLLMLGLLIVTVGTIFVARRKEVA